MFNIIHKSKNPKYLIITPLLEDVKISDITIKTVSNNNIQFDWISYTGNNNIPKNTVLGLAEYEKNNDILPYIIKIDNNTIWKENTLDEMYKLILKSKKNIGYIYSSFSYIQNNIRVAQFINIPFNKDKLKQSNYISSNSMIKRNLLKKCPFITDEKYKRLLDYAHWLYFLKKGYEGKLCKEGYFESIMLQHNISAGSNKDYFEKLKRVHRDFL